MHAYRNNAIRKRINMIYINRDSTNMLKACVCNPNEKPTLEGSWVVGSESDLANLRKVMTATFDYVTHRINQYYYA